MKQSTIFTIVAIGLLFFFVGNHYDWNLKEIPVVGAIVDKFISGGDESQNGPQSNHTQELNAERVHVTGEIIVQKEMLEVGQVKSNAIQGQADSLGQLIVKAEQAGEEFILWEGKPLTQDQAREQLANYLRLLVILKEEEELRENLIASLKTAHEELTFRIIKTEQAISFGNARKITASVHRLLEENSKVLADVFDVMEKSESVVKSIDVLYRELDSPKTSRPSVDKDVEALLSKYRSTSEDDSNVLTDDVANVVSIIKSAK